MATTKVAAKPAAAATTAKRVGTGMYSVNGQTIKATSEAAALASYNKANPSATTTKAAATTQNSQTASATPATPGSATNLPGFSPTYSPYQLGNGQDVNLGSPGGALTAGQYAIQQNTNQQELNNRFNTNNSYGSESYSIDPATGRVIKNQDLNAQEQQKLDQNRQRDIGLGNVAGNQANQVSQAFQNPYSLQGIANDPSQMDFSKQRADQENQLNARFEALNGDNFKRAQDSLDSSLLNKGIPMGSDLWNKEHERLSRQQDDARQGFQTQAMQMAGGEMSRSYDLGNQARQQSISEYNTQRDAPINEMSQVLNARGQVNNPTFQATNSINNQFIDPTQASLGYYQADSNQANQGAQRDWQAQQNQLDRNVQLQGINKASHGGSGSNYDPYAMANINYQNSLGLQNNAAKLAQQNAAYAQSLQGKPASPYVQMGQGVAQGITTGIGAGIGKGVSGAIGSIF